MRLRMRTELVEDALTWPLPTEHLTRASCSTPTGDAKYTRKDFAELTRAHGVVHSVGRKGDCSDNADAESSFATNKRELIQARSWPIRAGLHCAVFD